MRRILLVLFLLGVVVVSFAGLGISAPGYMDAEYYYSGGLRLAGGHGLTELIVWNYLGDVTSLPAPSHTYWMPLASLLAAAGIKLSGLANFTGARLLFLLAAAFVPPLTARLTFALTHQTRHAWLAGLLAVFPGYYLPYWATTETFALVMLLGALLLIWANVSGQPFSAGAGLRFAVAGFLAGLMHLARADGLLWLVVVLGLAVLQAYLARGLVRHWLAHLLPLLLVILVGYALPTGFWYARNLREFGALLPPGGSRALWLTDYDQLFSYPGSLLTPQSWLAGGWLSLLRVRLDALAQNLKTLVAVQGAVILLPLALVGLWCLRSVPRVRLGVLLWGLALAVMTVVFPFAGSRGGFFHSSAAFQPLLWASVPLGLEAFIAFGVKWRPWQPARAFRGFSILLVGLSAVFTLAMYANLVLGTGPFGSPWGRSWQEYQAIEQGLAQYGAGPYHTVMINNPPGFFSATGRSAIVLPDGEIDTLLSAGRKFAATYVVIEANHVAGLNALYDQPGDRPGLIYLGAQGDARFYQIIYSPT